MSNESASPHRARIVAALLDAEGKAWEALSGYKFWMFGYHAARWVNYNMLLAPHERLRSPFRSLVKHASAEVERREDERPVAELDAQIPMMLGSEGDGA